jgi:23S rRNA (cytosine1962-C5)-methyltransferase
MSAYHVLPLVAGKEANVGFKHPWVFSGALAKVDEKAKHGSLVHVADRHGKIIGTGTYSNKSSIAVRVFAFGDAVIDRAWMAAKLRAAQDRRLMMGYGPDTETTGYRVCFGEADGIPGLVVDRYEDAFVFQMATAGLDALREEVIGAIVDVFAPSVLVERSDMPSRREEGLEPVSQVHIGEAPESVTFKENGLTFVADIVNGQKTGFFFDQKDLRATVGRVAKGSVLNLFSYTGATGVYAMKGSAERVHNIDGSQAALELVAANAKKNKIKAADITTEEADAFNFMNNNKDSQYDTVIIDPPALIKSGKDAEEGKKAYHFLNRAGMRLVKDGGIFITSSCSHHLPEEDLMFLLRRASVQAGVHLDILASVRQAADHPMSVYFPESLYLKSFVCRVSR